MGSLRAYPVPLPAVYSAPTTAEEAYRNFLVIGEAYFTGGAEPRVDGRTYVEAWPALLSYVHSQREPLAGRGVVEAELAAGSRLCRELAESLAELAMAPPLPVMLNRSVIESAIAKLERMREAVRRMSRGADGARIVAQFGAAMSLDPSRPAQVAEAISYFIEGAHQNLDRMHLFRLVTADLEELKSHRRAMLSLCAAGGRGGEPSFARADRLLAALEGLYASLATAIAQAFPAGDERRIEGLRRIPRARERRRYSDPPERTFPVPQRP